MIRIGSSCGGSLMRVCALHASNPELYVRVIDGQGGRIKCAVDDKVDRVCSVLKDKFQFYAVHMLLAKRERRRAR